jgi:hypothetical protein
MMLSLVGQLQEGLEGLVDLVIVEVLAGLLS